MNFPLDVLDEPLLEFGNGGRAIDPRLGLMEHGPLQPGTGDKVRLAVIGTKDTVEGFERFVERCRTGIPAPQGRLANLRPPFPGLGNANPFRCSFEVETGGTAVLPRRDIERILREKDNDAAVRAAVDLFANHALAVHESSARPDVVMFALPTELIERVVNDSVTADAEDEPLPDHVPAGQPLDFRDLLKARTLHHRCPSQIVWPTTWDDSLKISRKLNGRPRRTQDPATRAWNLFNALFYKAGRVPWRLHTPEGGLKTSYCGISFYRDETGLNLLTSSAQMFDERGRGLILKGGRARTERNERHPYLTREDAYDLLRRALDAYRMHHRHYPARLVLYKTSRFNPGEVAGFEAALEEAQVDARDFVWIQEGSPLMLMREGDYPPLRGSVLEFGRETMLYTRGSVPFFKTYPGQRVPKPLLLRPYQQDSTNHELAAETLALTKMNWNSTQFDGSTPITLKAARQVGRILKHVPQGLEVPGDYRYFI